MTVNGDISDLFFNRDLTHVKRYDKRGNFDCFDPKALREEASDFICALGRLGVTACDLPTVDELVADFEERV